MFPSPLAALLLVSPATAFLLRLNPSIPAIPKTRAILNNSLRDMAAYPDDERFASLDRGANRPRERAYFGNRDDYSGNYRHVQRGSNNRRYGYADSYSNRFYTDRNQAIVRDGYNGSGGYYQGRTNAKDYRTGSVSGCRGYSASYSTPYSSSLDGRYGSDDTYGGHWNYYRGESSRFPNRTPATAYAGYASDPLAAYEKESPRRMPGRESHYYPPMSRRSNSRKEGPNRSFSYSNRPRDYRSLYGSDSMRDDMSGMDREQYRYPTEEGRNFGSYYDERPYVGGYNYN